MRNADKRVCPFFSHSADGGLGDVAHDPVDHLRLEHGVSGVDAHAAGVGAGVVLADAFVILRGQKPEGNADAVAQTES